MMLCMAAAVKDAADAQSYVAQQLIAAFGGPKSEGQ